MTKMARRKRLETDEATGAAVAAALERLTPGHGEEFEWRINQLESIQSKLLTKQLYLFSYDIGEGIKHKCPNPAWMLWPRMGPFQLSLWVAEEETLDDPAILELQELWRKYPVRGFDTENGVRHSVLPLHENATQATLENVLFNLCGEVVRQHTSFITRLGNAADRMKVEEESLKKSDTKGRAKVESAYDNALRGIIKEAAQHMEAALGCARRFDETECTKDLFAGLRALIRSEALVFNARMKAKDSKPAIVPEKQPSKEVFVLVRGMEQAIFLPRSDPVEDGEEERVRVVRVDRKGLRVEQEFTRNESECLYLKLTKEGWKDS